MTKQNPEVIDYYNQEVVKRMMDKYGYEPLAAFRIFVESKTHEMLEDVDCGMTEFGAPAIFEIWEAEQITGDPRNSVYIRED